MGVSQLTFHQKRHKAHPSFSSWICMKTRCQCPTHSGYHNYGGRGIKVCPEWSSFNQFLKDMGDRPKGYTLDRIDPDGDYSKENCKWATPKEQQNNRRNNRKIN